MSTDAQSMALRRKLQKQAEQEAAEKEALLHRVGRLEAEVQANRRKLVAIAKHLGLDPDSL